MQPIEPLVETRAQLRLVLGHSHAVFNVRRGSHLHPANGVGGNQLVITPYRCNLEVPAVSSRQSARSSLCLSSFHVRNSFLSHDIFYVCAAGRDLSKHLMKVLSLGDDHRS